MPKAAVDFGAATETRSFDVADRHATEDGGHPAPPIQLLHGLGRAAAVVRCRVVAFSFFEHRYVEPSEREFERRDGAAGAGADDEHLCACLGHRLAHDETS